MKKPFASVSAADDARPVKSWDQSQN